MTQRPMHVVAAAILAMAAIAGAVRLAAEVVGGSAIPSDQLSATGPFEWLVRLEGPQGTCTGSLVSAEWVLTAAHCQTSTTAFVGDDTAGVAVVDAVAHPLFVAGQTQFDVALLRLATPSVRRPVRRAPTDLQVQAGSPIAIAGWGQTSAGGSLPTEPRTGTAAATSVDDTALATGASAVGCNGDSGGPMLSSNRLFAVVTSSDAQCSAQTLGLRLSAIAEWVTEVAGPGPVDQGVTVRSGALTVNVGETIDVPYEFSSTVRPMTLADITAFEDGPFEFQFCDGEAPPTVCHYVNAADFVGTTQLSYTVSDGQRTAVARWTVQVVRPPTRPVASDLAIGANAGVPVQVGLSAFDANGDALTYTIVTAPTHGALAGCASGTCSYTSNPGFVGTDAFTWTASDGVLVSDVATVSIVVQPALPPTVTNGSATIALQAPLELTLDAVDPNGDSVVFAIVTPPAHGTLTDCSLGACTYVADAGFLGDDSFTWRATDGVLTSALATFTVHIVPHLPPVAFDSSNTVKRDSLRHIQFDGDDPEGAPVVLTIVAGPQHGTVSNCTILSCDYRPEPGFVGTDSMRYTVSDGEFSSTVATFTMEVVGGNWAVQPVASPGDALALATAIVGRGAVIRNASLVGAPVAAGTFTGALDAIGFDAGVVLSTGRAADAIGPNLGLWSSVLSTPGDADVSPDFTADAAALSFDLVPTGSVFTVRYVFASDEVGEFASGEGVRFLVNGQNCALVDGAPVSLSSIPGHLFIDNPAGSEVRDTEMDGLTTVLTCTAPVVPGEPNRIKIVVADTIDAGIDSAVFIEGSVFTNAAPTVDAGLAVAGLEGAPIQLLGSASDDDGDPLTITWAYQPQSGVDPLAACVFAAAATVSPQLLCTDDGSYVVTMTANDGVNAPAASTTTVVVSNGSPAASIVAPVPNLVVAVGATARVQALITDAGANDTHTCEIHWGDGAVTSAPAVNDACSATHQYSAVGTRTVVVTATDDDDASGSDSRSLAIASALPVVLGDGQVRVNGGNVQIGILAGPAAGTILVTSRAGGTLVGASVTSVTLSGGTATVSGRGLWNGRPGYTYSATVVDNGRNGRSGAPRDRFAVTVVDPAGTVAYAIATELASGDLVVRR